MTELCEEERSPTVSRTLDDLTRMRAEGKRLERLQPREDRRNHQTKAGRPFPARNRAQARNTPSGSQAKASQGKTTKRGSKSEMKPVESEETAQKEAYKTDDKFTSTKSHPPSGSEDGENSLPEHVHEETEKHPLGEDGDNIEPTTPAFNDPMVDIGKVIADFERVAGQRLRGKTPQVYKQIFRRFVTRMSFSQYTRRQIAGRIGRELLLKYLLNEDFVPLASKRTQCAALKAIWEDGLRLPFPMNARKDLGEIPEVQRRQSPRDSEVEPWLKALEIEEDNYLRICVLLIFQLGIRPSHVCLIRWKHIQYDSEGKPYSIVTTGREKGNKRMVPIRARLPPDLSEAISQIKALLEPLPEDPLLPHRKGLTEYLKSEPMTVSHYEVQWHRFEKKHLLSHLRPVDLRHWVASTCRKAGLSLAARNAMQGHKHRNWNEGLNYDNPQDADIFDEQAMKLPHGPIGFINPKIEVTQALPTELLESLSKCLSGEIKPSQHHEAILAYMTRRLENQNSPTSPQFIH